MTLRYLDSSKGYVPRATGVTVYVRPWTCPACDHLNGNMVPCDAPEPFRVDCEKCGAACDGYHPKIDPDFPRNRYVQVSPQPDQPRWFCPGCGYQNGGSICTKCGNLREEQS